MAIRGSTRSDPAEVRRYVADLAAALLRDLPRLTDRLVEEIFANEPFHRDSLVSRDDLWRSCHDNVERHLETIVDTGRPAAEGARMRDDAATATGRRRAEQGFPLEALLHAYRVGGRVIWEAFVDEARRSDPSSIESLLDGGTLVWEVVDVHSTAVADAYRRTEFELVRRRELHAQALFDALLASSEPSAIAAEAASALDIPEAGPYVIVTLELVPEGRGRLGRAQEHVQSLGFRSAWRVRTEREIGLVALGDANIEHAVGVLDTITNGRIGVSPVVNGLAEAGAGYLMAETALATIQPGGHGVALLDAALERALIVRAPEIARRLRDRVLGPLADLPASERALLVETLGAYLDCEASASKTAARLFCHRNTIFNRLRRVEALTGRSLSDPKDLVALALALEADQLLPPA